ncbi:MAG: purine-nucleoside phosphorylase [bacterium]|nr:purine-nucleoside phosphorylase [bacterium]
MDELEATTAVLRRQGFEGPDLGIVLGSGLGFLADEGKIEAALPFASIPGFPPATVDGHAGRLVRTRVGGVEALILQGRLHHYEGYTLAAVVFPIRVLIRLGVRVLVLTNAAGGLAPELGPGDLMLITDHLNFLGDNPLRGPNLAALGPRFPALARAYSPDLIQAALAAAGRLGLRLAQGVYAAVAGPSYETPAEARFLRWAGADAVGMSTVPEVIAACHAGVRVLAISCITNSLCGADSPSHHDVLAVARAAGQRLGALLEAMAPDLVGGEGLAGGRSHPQET